MTVTWTLRTPLLLPAGIDAEPGGRVVLPGSAVKGAVRSLHETLMGGCLKVAAEDFVPVYREPAVTKGENWRLAVVSESTRQGRATRIRIAEETAWVPVGFLRQALGRVPRTGDTVDIDEQAIWAHDGLGRQEVSDQDGVAPGDDWVVLVGDSGTRLKSERFFCAAGRTPDDEDASWEVPVAAWAEYDRVCEGTNDMRLIRQKPDAPAYKGWRNGRVFTAVRWPGGGDVVGERRQVTGRLWPGDVVWAEVNPVSGAVEHLSMAAIWRRPGEGALTERIPDAVRPCRDPSKLCVSCRLFGSADTAGVEPGLEADQRSYAGHLRIGDAVAEDAETAKVRLGPLGAPRPGAGQFYLNIASTSPATGEAELPSAYWGSELDSPGPRQVRGRKFYWHGDPSVQSPPRHLARPGQRNEAMTGERTLVAVGTCFRQEIAFDNISRAELGSVLLTLLPRLVLPRAEGLQAADYLLRLGGGKPLGLGSCAVEVTGLQWQDVRQRYLGQQMVSQEPGDFFGPVAGDVLRLAGHKARQHWPTLSRILRADAVDPALIWYPLGGDWSDERNRDRAFRFFARTNGRPLRTRTEPVVPLPDPSPGHDQQLRSL
jgi:hypothetical protein